MTISNTASALRPGVCTSSTRPTTPYEGQVIYETDTDKTLVWNGSAWVYLSTSTANPVGLELVNSVSVGSGVTSVTMTAAFPSGYNTFRVVWSGGTMTSSSGDSQISAQLGSGGTWLNSNYYATLLYVQRSTNTTTRAAGNENASTLNWIGGGWTNGAMADVTLTNVNESVKTFWQSSAYIQWGDAGQGAVSGFINNSNAYTDIKLLVTGTGTMSGGKVYSYGYRTA